MTTLSLWISRSINGGLFVDDQTVATRLSLGSPGRVAARIEVAAGGERLTLATDIADNEFRVEQLPRGFTVACSATDGHEDASPLVTIRCPAGPVAVFQVFDLLNGSEVTELVAVVDERSSIELPADELAAHIMGAS